MLTNDDIADFLAAAGANPSCGICGQNNWFLNQEDAARTAMILKNSADGSFTIPPAHIPIIWMVCNNCGNLRMHSREVIEQWRAKHRKSSLSVVKQKIRQFTKI